MAAVVETTTKLTCNADELSVDMLMDFLYGLEGSSKIVIEQHTKGKPGENDSVCFTVVFARDEGSRR